MPIEVKREASRFVEDRLPVAELIEASEVAPVESLSTSSFVDAPSFAAPEVAPLQLRASTAPSLAAHALQRADFARSKQHMASLLSFVDFNHFADLSSIGVKDTNHFMTELLSEGYAAQSPERRTAIQQALVDQVVPYVNGKQTIAGATRILCESLGPGWVKFMQILAVRAEVVKDPEFRAEFRRASEENKAQPLSALEPVLVASLGENWRDRFSEIDEHAFATGSVAQGHHAKTKAGEEVVVKIAKPESVVQLVIDTKLIRSITDRLAPHSRVVADATQVLAEGVGEELDFTKEAAVTARAHARSPEDAPRVFAELSGPQVLTTAFIAGQSLGKAQATLRADPVRGKKVATAYFNEIARQIFSGGEFHADPSAGNVILSANDKLVFIDFGAHGELGAQGPILAAAVQALLGASHDAIITDANAKQLTTMLSWLFGYPKYSHELFAIISRGGDFASMVDRLAQDKRLQIPSELKKAFKVLAQAEGLAKEIDPHFSAADAFVQTPAATATPPDLVLLRAGLSHFIPESMFGPEMVQKLGLQNMTGKEFMLELFCDDLAQLGPSERAALSREMAERWSKGESQDAMMTALFRYMSPGYIKGLQILSSRADIVTDATQRDAIAKLCERAGTVPFSELEHLVPKAPGLAGLQIDPRPIAAASMGQVHVGTLPDGQVLALKFLKPGARERLPESLQRLQKFFATHAPGAIFVRDMLLELQRGAHNESHLLSEARKTKEVARSISADSTFAVPEVYLELSTNDVLVSRFEPGLLKIGAPGTESGAAYSALLQQIFHIGIFHGDTSTGNVKFKDSKPMFLDWGFSGQISPSEQLELRATLLMMIKGDKEKAASHAQSLVPRNDWSKAQSHKKEFDEILSIPNFVEKMDRLSQVDFGLSGGVVTALKAMVQLAGEETKANPGLDITALFKKAASARDVARAQGMMKAGHYFAYRDLLAFAEHPDTSPEALAELMRGSSQVDVQRRVLRHLDVPVELLKCGYKYGLSEVVAEHPATPTEVLERLVKEAAEKVDVYEEEKAARSNLRRRAMSDEQLRQEREVFRRDPSRVRPIKSGVTYATETKAQIEMENIDRELAWRAAQTRPTTPAVDTVRHPIDLLITSIQRTVAKSAGTQ